ncbi:MAG: hypothetical protein U0V48_16670 [Anaerolineales bacterium]
MNYAELAQRVEFIRLPRTEEGFSLPVTWNSGRQGDGTPSLALSELMGWWERQGRRMNDEG